MALYTDVVPPDKWLKRWTICGDLRAPGTGFEDDANYEARDAHEKSFPNIDFDPETSCFYAYGHSEDEIKALAMVIDDWVKLRRQKSNESSTT